MWKVRGCLEGVWVTRCRVQICRAISCHTGSQVEKIRQNIPKITIYEPGESDMLMK